MVLARWEAVAQVPYDCAHSSGVPWGRERPLTFSEWRWKGCSKALSLTSPVAPQQDSQPMLQHQGNVREKSTATAHI